MDVSLLADEDRALWEALGDAKPSRSPLPKPGAPNELNAALASAEMIGKPLIPWQRWVMRLATERLPSGRYRFPEFVLTVPRQSGKTTLVTVLLLTRSLLYPGREAYYSAQSGKDASSRWSDMAQLVELCTFSKEFTIRRGVGYQSINSNRTKSSIKPFAPTSTSLHGYTPHDVVLDEIFAHDAIAGKDLMGAIKPAQQTLPTRQLVMLSTAGNAGSVFLKERVDVGRAALDSDQDAGYIEWALPDDADPYDEGNWSFHPALGHLVQYEDLREIASSLDKGEWKRAFMNQWVENASLLFDMVRWRELGSSLEAPALSDCVLGFSQSSDRTRGCIVAAWLTSEGKYALKVVKSTTDLGSFAVMVAELHERRPKALVADDGGLDRALVDEVRRALPEWARDDVIALSPREWTLASAGLESAIRNGRIVHDSDPQLTAAVATALSRQMGEAWALSHRSSPEVIAAAAALRTLETTPVEESRIEVHFA